MTRNQRIEHHRDFVPHQNKSVSYGTAGNVKFRRIAGGIQWPSLENPGFALLITEDVNETETSQLHHLRVILEQEDHRIDGLLRWCEQRSINSPREIPIAWHGDVTHKPNMKFVYALKKSMTQQGQFDTLKVVKFPYVDQRKERRDDFFIEILRKYLDKKAIHWGRESRLETDLSVIQDELTNPFLALCYAMSALVVWPNAGRIRE